MSCGCIDNKNLNKDKLSIDTMKGLSIDEIISLYRQGYVLEELDNKVMSLDNRVMPLVNGGGYAF